MTLVRNLTGSSIESQLSFAYKALATCFLQHRSGLAASQSVDDITSLDLAIRGTEDPIDLRELRTRCESIGNDSERPVEVYNNLGHIFVLLKCIPILSSAGLSAPDFCSPTQQADHQGVRIADLEGKGWALEAYGGGNIKNNGKLAKDLRTLANRANPETRTFLAFRQLAFQRDSKWTNGQEIEFKQNCPPSHGGPFKAVSRAQLLETRQGVSVFELFDIAIESE